LVDWSGLIVARAKEQAPKTKRAGSNLPSSILLHFRKETRGEKGRLGHKAQKPALGKEEPLPFLARRMLFCPGMGPLGHRGNLLFAEPIENTPFSEKMRLFFSTKLEMILKK